MARYATAAVLIIGNEILSGRTREANGWLAAQKLFAVGCKLEEIAVVPDRSEIIIATLNRLRRSYDAVMTSGGIGPTHDDITMQAVADACGVPLLEDDSIIAAMSARFGHDGVTPGRRLMARVPQGAELIHCPLTPAPGCRIGNVYVFAGVPPIFASQLESVLVRFGSTPFLRVEVVTAHYESSFALPLSKLQKQFPTVEIGSYPSHGNHRETRICLSGPDHDAIHIAEEAVHQMLKGLETSVASYQLPVVS